MAYLRDPSLFPPRRNPYPHYHQLGELGPVLWDTWLRSWLVLGHEEISRLLKDARLSGIRLDAFYEQLPATARTEMAVLKRALSDMMLFNEPPRHTRLRQLIKPSLIPVFIREIRSAIEQITDALLDRAIPNGGMDVIRDLSEPLTREVIARLAGVPEHGKPLLNGWQGLLHEFYSVSTTQIPRVTALRSLFDSGAHARRTGLATDGFSGMIADQLIGDHYTEDEIFANFLLLIDAGQATTTHQIANAVLALCEAPDQQRLLRERPDLAASAAHEFMRFDSAVQFTSRVAAADIEIGGQRIRSGDSVALVLAAGNRDPRRYEDADRLDVTRRAFDHLSFGHGIHYCLGASLALAETEIAISRLLARTCDLRVAERELDWLDSINFRFLRRLPLSFTPIRDQRFA